MPNLIKIVKYVMFVLLRRLGGHQICENILMRKQILNFGPPPQNHTFSQNNYF